MKARTPLGLPRGSVRALLTLMIVAVVIAETVRGNPVPVFWTETLMIALAHYFTSRRFIDLSPDVIRRLEEEGHLDKEANPLYLPRHSIRAIVVAAFVGLAAYLYREGRLWKQEALSVLLIVFAYLVGVMLRPVLNWWAGKGTTPAIRWWDDIKALAVLLTLAITATAHLSGRADLLPQFVRPATLGLVLFYFGSR